MASLHDRFAPDYDEQIRRAECYLTDIMFGLTCEFVKAGDRLLDVGIGTGMSSVLFRRAGLLVFGIDGSAKMLEVCREREIAQELTGHDITALPWPYQDRNFDHVISCGVFHFIGDLAGVFSELARVQVEGGVLGFTTMRADGPPRGSPGYERRTEDGIDVYSHRPEYVRQLLTHNHYRREKEATILVGNSFFSAVVARKGGL